eukprot:TRINITY_DN3329_c0_g1_i1.p1 TRINITY_DN3329_c0_g1~~TRINITY_DN3329_c0_g1_i1.p1  ORF type:complete len:537 (+),score=71.20 TRINITY_DN3329_c0_g1_i1:147-1757(+)
MRETESPVATIDDVANECRRLAAQHGGAAYVEDLDDLSLKDGDVGVEPLESPGALERARHRGPAGGGGSFMEAAMATSLDSLCSIAAQGQWVDGQEIWPEQWGITVRQFRTLIEDCRDDPAWRRENSVRVLVRDFIRPRTAGTGKGYALMVNENNPKEVNILISHSWNENAEEFLECLERSVRPDDGLFICALSLFQCEDGSGPSIQEQIGTHAREDPFQRVLRYIWQTGRAAGHRWWPMCTPYEIPIHVFLAAIVLVLLSGAVNPQDRHIWDDNVLFRDSTCLHDCKESGAKICSCWHVRKMTEGERVLLTIGAVVFLIGACLAVYIQRVRIYTGRMLIVPNREDDIYTRLWCVYEIFCARSVVGVPVSVAHTAASCGVSHCADAQCTNPRDAERIRGEIEAYGLQSRRKKAASGYAAVDSSIRAVMRKGWWSLFIRMAFVYIVGCVVTINRGEGAGLQQGGVGLQVLFAKWMTMLVWFAILIGTALRTQGQFTIWVMVAVVASYVVAAFLLFMMSNFATSAYCKSSPSPSFFPW